MGLAGNLRGYNIIIVEEGDELDDETIVEEGQVYFQGDKMHCTKEVYDALIQRFGESKD